MSSKRQQAWNIFTGFDRESIVLARQLAPSCSWWVGSDQDFCANYQRELPRILISKTAETIRPILLGGRLP